MWARQAEPLDGDRHPERLVRPKRVVGGDVPVEGALDLSDGGEAPGQQQLVSKGPVEPLDLAGGGRRAGRREEVTDPVLAAIRSNKTSRRFLACRPLNTRPLSVSAAWGTP